MTTITGLVLALFAALTLNASDLMLSTGIQLTPNKQAIDGGKVWNQESRIGPSAGLTFTKWFTTHQGVFAEGNYANTNTRLGDYNVNTWTMNRVSVDGGYIYSWRTGRFSEYIKAGIGTMVTVSGMALNNTSAGLDRRIEGLAAAGISYKFSRRFSAVLEYEGREIRNPDFTDHTWKPQRVLISEPRIGITYMLGQNR